MTLEKFMKDMKDRDKEIKEVRSHWPYDYDAGFQAFEVEHEGNTFYFCFRDDGKLLQKKILPKF